MSEMEVIQPGQNKSLPHIPTFLECESRKLSDRGGKHNLVLLTQPNFILFFWRVIALQFCVGFCCIIMWISCKQTYISSLLSLPPTPPQPTALGCHTALSRAPCAIQQLPTSQLLHLIVCIHINATFPICLTLSFSHCVHSSVLYICASSPTPQVGSSVPFLLILSICINIPYLFFFFLLYCV